MEIKYADIHSHLGFGDYGKDLEEVVSKMSDLGVSAITVGTDLESSKEAIRIASEYENVYACIGAHPADNRKFVFDEKDFNDLADDPKVVAIGECGLDYFHIEKVFNNGENLAEDIKKEKERQKREFIKQIEFAVKYDKPLMLHIRDAYEDAYEILKKYKGKARGNLHFFAASLDWADLFIKLGFTVSFTGVITFARQYDEIIKNIPLDKIHAETDSPFVAPIPYRGKRNEPGYVIEVVKKIAEIRGEDFEKVRSQLLENARRDFGMA